MSIHHQQREDGQGVRITSEKPANPSLKTRSYLHMKSLLLRNKVSQVLNDWFKVQSMHIKVGCSCAVISKPWGQTNGQLHSFNKSWCQTAASGWKCPKTQFWDPLTNWNLNPFQGPTHTLTQSSIHTQNRSNKSDISYLKTSWGFDIPIHSRTLLAAILCWLVTL